MVRGRQIRSGGLEGEILFETGAGNGRVHGMGWGGTAGVWMGRWEGLEGMVQNLARYLAGGHECGPGVYAVIEICASTAASSIKIMKLPSG